MAKYRSIQMSFWTDTKINETFTPEQKLMYLYLLTNPHTSLCGCYEIGLKTIAYETGFDCADVMRLLSDLERIHDVIRYDENTNEILIINWIKYHIEGGSTKTITGIKRGIEDVKNSDFKAFLNGVLENKNGVSMPHVKNKMGYFENDMPHFENDMPHFENDMPHTRNETKRNETKRKRNVNENDKDSRANDVFERLWQRYPRKKGKTQVSKTQRLRLLKLGEDVLNTCIDRFLDDMGDRNIDYIPYGSTFFNSGYMDYLDDEPQERIMQESVKPPEKPPDPNKGLDKVNDDDPDDRIKHPPSEGWRINDSGYWVKT